jgi:hypothetical protein
MHLGKMRLRNSNANMGGGQGCPPYPNQMA